MTTAAKVDLAGDASYVLVDLLEAAKAGLADEVPSLLDDRSSEIARAYGVRTQEPRSAPRRLAFARMWAVVE
jgi:hypothetical protein